MAFKGQTAFMDIDNNSQWAKSNCGQVRFQIRCQKVLKNSVTVLSKIILFNFYPSDGYSVTFFQLPFGFENSESLADLILSKAKLLCQKPSSKPHCPLFIKYMVLYLYIHFKIFQKNILGNKVAWFLLQMFYSKL